VGSPSRRAHDDIDLNSISEPDLRGSPKISRSRNKFVNPFTVMHNGGIDPHIVSNVPTTPTLSVHIKLQQFREWRSCCLRNLGIIHVKPKLSNSAISLRSSSRFFGHDPVIVKELLPESVASKKLLPGDHIVSVNGNEVNQSNVDLILARVGLTSHELVLQVLRGSGSGQTSAAAGTTDSDLVKLLSRKGSHCSPKPVHRLPHLLMYLTLNTTEDDDENKVNNTLYAVYSKILIAKQPGYHPYCIIERSQSYCKHHACIHVLFIGHLVYVSQFIGLCYYE